MAGWDVQHRLMQAASGSAASVSLLLHVHGSYWQSGKGATPSMSSLLSVLSEIDPSVEGLCQALPMIQPCTWPLCVRGDAGQAKQTRGLPCSSQTWEEIHLDLVVRLTLVLDGRLLASPHLWSCHGPALPSLSVRAALICTPATIVPMHLVQLGYSHSIGTTHPASFHP